MNAREIVPPGQAVQEYLAQKECQEALVGVPVPTLDAEVRAALVAFGEPADIDENGRSTPEDRGQRRQRLQTIIAKRKLSGLSINWKSEHSDSDSEPEEEFWTEGSPHLWQTRHLMANLAKQAASKRLKKARKAWTISSGPMRAHILREEGDRRRLANRKAGGIELYGTQSGFTRPVGCVRYSPLSNYIATGDWSGLIRVMDPESLEELTICQAHSGKATIAWNTSKANPTPQLISGGVEGNVCVHHISDNRLVTKTTLSGHTGRISAVDWHPHAANLVASASHDLTWRLWDLETEQDVWIQEGHARELSRLRFHPDGALIVSTGLDGIGRVWDMRTGSSVLILDGHAREIHALDVASNGYEVATGAADNTIRIWDLRKGQTSALIPAHTSVVSDVQFCQDFLVSSGFDSRVRLWSVDDWLLRGDLESGAKVMSAHCSPSLEVISGRWDRCVDLFRPINV